MEVINLDNVEDLIPHEDEEFAVFELQNLQFTNFVSLFENRERLPERWKPKRQYDFLCFKLKNCEVYYKCDERGNYYLHREFDKPAFIGYNGVKIWYKNGRPHRENNPAFISIRNGI